MYVKEIQSKLLADAEARSQISDSFPKMHINAKNKVLLYISCISYNINCKYIHYIFLIE